MRNDSEGCIRIERTAQCAFVEVTVWYMVRGLMKSRALVPYYMELEKLYRDAQFIKIPNRKQRSIHILTILRIR